MRVIKQRPIRTIPWSEPQVGPKEYQLVKKVLASGFLNDGEVTAELERRLAKLLHLKYVVACTSGTSALYLALKACGVREGDEILVPDLTFVATANAVKLTGAKVIPVDIDPKTLALDPREAKRAVTSRTKAIIPVHVSGRAANMPSVLALAKEYNLTVIEDTAEALGSKTKGQFLGTIGNAGCFSFTANKIITCGQGGVVATHDEAIYRKLKMLKDHGRPSRGTGGDDVHKEWGFNFKLTNVQAAILLGQLDMLSARLKRLCAIYKKYHKLLHNQPQIRLFPFTIHQGERPLWIDAVAQNRDGLLSYLSELCIETRKFWLPIHAQPAYKENSRKFPNSTTASAHGFWLPSSFLMQDSDIEYVCNHITEYYRKYG